MRNSIEGHVVLVTGGARGMGASHVRRLVEAGAKVVATDVLDDEGQATVAELGDSAIYAHHDVTSDQDWIAAVALAEETYGPVNHLVNNAGIVTYGGIEDGDPAEFRRIIDINLVGVWLGMHYTVPSMRRAIAAGANDGAIVNISSTAGLIGYGNIGGYVASKWGVRGITKSAALELGPHGIRVNSVHPGPIRTPMTSNLQERGESLPQPIGRIGEPEEVSDLVLFLIADATYSTGHEFVIDGGAVVGQFVTGPQ